MSFTHLLTQPVTILRAATSTDGVGDTIEDWSTPTETTVNGWLTQISESEVINRRDAQISDAHLFLDADVDILATDRVIANGVLYEVNGPPAHAHTPRGPHHLEVALNAVSG